MKNSKVRRFKLRFVGTSKGLNWREEQFNERLNWKDFINWWAEWNYFSQRSDVFRQVNSLRTETHGC